MAAFRLVPVLLCTIVLSCSSLQAAGFPDSLGAIISRLDTQLKSNNRDYPALLERGRALLAAGKLDQARRDFDTARFSEDKNTVAQAHLGLGDVYRAMPKRRVRAVGEYRKAMAASQSVSSEALYRIANTAFEMRMTEGYLMACDALGELLNNDPCYKDALDIWWTKIFTQSEDDLRSVCRRLEESEERGIATQKELLFIARIKSRLGEPRNVLKVLEKLDATDWDSVRAERMLLRAESLLEIEDTLGFEQSYNQALESAAAEGDFTPLFQQAEAIFNPTESEKWDSLSTPEEKASFFHKFWKRRDPDPTTAHNERLLTHYRRLHEAEKQYWDWTPHSLFSTSYTYYRLLASRPVFEFDSPYFDSKYDPDLWWDNCRGLALQQRGLFYIRHGEPDRIHIHGLPWEFNPEKMIEYDAWQYGNNYILFNRANGFYHAEKNYAQQADITEAMHTETYRDPLPQVPQASSGVDFKGPSGKVEVEFYNSVPVSRGEQPLEASQAAIVVYDMDWRELERRASEPRKVFTGRDSMWIAVNSLLLDPGENVFASRIEIPGYRAVVRRLFKTGAYPDELCLSGIVLASPPEPGTPVHNRWGIELMPRPSLAFRQGEMITVYVEIYGLTAGPEGYAFDERVTVNLDSGMADESIIRRIFGSREPRTSLTLNFERHPDAGKGTFPEHFTVDTSELVPGDYSLVIGIKDRNGGEEAKRGCAFKLVE